MGFHFLFIIGSPTATVINKQWLSEWILFNANFSAKCISLWLLALHMFTDLDFKYEQAHWSFDKNYVTI